MQPYLHKNFTGNITKLILLSLIILQSVEATERLRIATTTSTENSGLLNLLNPAFEQKYSIALDVIAVGSGKALRLAENGDVDLIFVHAPAAEIGFIKAGYGIERKSVMHNDFVVLGAPTNPANINNADSLAQVMLKIHNASSTFISRGDDSGTHKKEMELWQSAKLSPAGTWYLSVGQGMGAVLQIANEKLAYTLTDRGTYLAFMDKIELQILYEQDPALFNRYHIILVNPQRHAHTRIESARKYSAFIRSEIGQNLIRDFRINGEPLFYPDVIK